MFQQTFINFLQSKLNEITEAIKSSEGKGYDVKVSHNIDFRPTDEDIIHANVIFGAQSKIEGSPQTYYQNYNVTVWAELKTNGLYTQRLFSYLFDEFSKTSFKLIDEDNTYSVFTDFGDLVLLDPRYQAGNTYRCKFAFTGNLIFSESSQIGRHTYIAFPTSSTTDANVVWYEVNAITPSEARDNNLQAKSTNMGMAYIKGNKAYSGNLGLIFENDEVSMKLVRYIHGDEDITSLWIKYEYQDYTAIEKKLRIQSVDIKLDENTKNTVLSIVYVKDDVYGI
jgi:hypothetical protein